MISVGVDVNQAKNDDGSTPLNIASQNGHVEAVKALLDAPGIDVNKATTSPAGTTTLEEEQNLRNLQKMEEERRELQMAAEEQQQMENTKDFIGNLRFSIQRKPGESRMHYLKMVWMIRKK